MENLVENPQPNTVPRWLVLDIIASVGVKVAEDNQIQLKFSNMGMEGMCPVFGTERGCLQYLKANNREPREGYNYIVLQVELEGGGEEFNPNSLNSEE